jgi:hypothetical protein
MQVQISEYVSIKEEYRYLSMSALLRMPEDQTVYTVYGSMNLGPPVAMVDSS